MDIDKIYNEDCLEGMKHIPSASVDMILCGLPYGTTRNKWDSVIPFEPLWEQYSRIIKPNGAICLWAQLPFSIKLCASNLKMLRYEWVIEKTMPTGFLNARRMPMKCHENVLVFYEKLPTYNPQMIKGQPHWCNLPAKTSSTSYGKYNHAVEKHFSDSYYPRDVLKVKTG